MNEYLRKVAIAFLLLAWLFLSPSSLSQEANDEPAFIQAADWRLDVSTSTLRDYMTYVGSKVQPIKSVQVAFSLRDQRTRVWQEPSIYEYLWYHSDNPIGCHRFFELSAVSAKQGIIRILPSEDASSDTAGLMNATIRLLLDVSLNNGGIFSLVIPADLYNQCTSSLGSLFFYEAHYGSAKDQMVLLHVVSDPPKFNKYFRMRTKIAAQQ